MKSISQISDKTPNLSPTYSLKRSEIKEDFKLNVTGS